MPARRIKSLLPEHSAGHYLYLIAAADGQIKVGHTRRLRDRLMNHRRTLGGAVAWCHAIPAGTKGAAWSAELDCIRHLAANGERIGRTEWFSGIDKATAIVAARAAVAAHLGA